MSVGTSLFASAAAEIVERHEFFVRWFADPTVDAAEFERCAQAFHGEFSMITPDGRVHRHAQVIEMLRAARGSVDAGFRIGIEDVVPLWQGEDTVLAGYIEAQQRDGRATRRRSTALFVKQASAPHGVAWRHLHETWVQA